MAEVRRNVEQEREQELTQQEAEHNASIQAFHDNFVKPELGLVNKILVLVKQSTFPSFEFHLLGESNNKTNLALNRVHTVKHSFNVLDQDMWKLDGRKIKIEQLQALLLTLYVAKPIT